MQRSTWHRVRCEYFRGIRFPSRYRQKSLTGVSLCLWSPSGTEIAMSRGGGHFEKLGKSTDIYLVPLCHPPANPPGVQGQLSLEKDLRGPPLQGPNVTRPLADKALCIFCPSLREQKYFACKANPQSGGWQIRVHRLFLHSL